jgi:hypothetical protein
MANCVSSPLKPTIEANIETIEQAIGIFGDFIHCQAMHVARRPFKLEWPKLVRAGTVFIYEPGSSGLERWDDLLLWNTKWSQDGVIFATFAIVTCEWPSHEFTEELATYTRLSINIIHKNVKHYIVSYQRDPEMVTAGLCERSHALDIKAN